MSLLRLAIATFPLLLACSGEGSSGASSTPLHFTDVTQASGLDLTLTSGHSPASEILEVKGGGLALIDYDGDGDQDLFAPNGATLAAPHAGPGCRLYENLGELRFRDVTRDAALEFCGWGMGVAAGDVDGDGHVDLFVACYGKNALLRNLGDGRFEELPDAGGAAGSAWSVAPAFGDLDGDGDLDLYVANYLEFDIANPPAPSEFKGAPVFRGPHGLTPTADELYENLGNGRFRPVDPAKGWRPAEPGYGLGCVILDFDGDGRLDVFVGNDSTPNFLLVNHGDWNFEERGARSGLSANAYGSNQSTMGIAIGDVNADGHPDVYTTNFSNDSNTLHVAKPGGFFDDETARYGLGMLAFPYVGWAAAFDDFDLDGDQDLLTFNGHVYPNASMEVMDSDLRQPPLLFRRTGPAFERVQADEAGSWLAAPHCDRGAVFDDLDGDGDTDVIVAELNGPLRLLRNDSNTNGWLRVRPIPATWGTRVELTTGTTTQSRWLHSGGSFASSGSPLTSFGLPSGSQYADVRVIWPDGNERRLAGVEPDRVLNVSRH